MAKITWRVSEAPTGRYRSFHKRAWPMAYYNDCDKVAASIYCEESYHPSLVRCGIHGPLTVRIADYSGANGSFVWKTLPLAKYNTLVEAKAAAASFIDRHKEIQPKVQKQAGAVPQKLSDLELVKIRRILADRLTVQEAEGSEPCWYDEHIGKLLGHIEALKAGDAK